MVHNTYVVPHTNMFLMLLQSEGLKGAKFKIMTFFFFEVRSSSLSLCSVFKNSGGRSSNLLWQGQPDLNTVFNIFQFHHHFFPLQGGPEEIDNVID